MPQCFLANSSSTPQAEIQASVHTSYFCRAGFHKTYTAAVVSIWNSDVQCCSWPLQWDLPPTLPPSLPFFSSSLHASPNPLQLFCLVLKYLQPSFLPTRFMERRAWTFTCHLRMKENPHCDGCCCHPCSWSTCEWCSHVMLYRISVSDTAAFAWLYTPREQS